MPACARKINNKWRVVECESGKLVRNRAGTPADGGGHPSEEAAKKQASAINMRSAGVRRN